MASPLKITFVSKSDLQGGAAVVTFRLMEALRAIGADARMLVCEKISESPYVEVCAPPKEIKFKFLKERAEIFVANGFSRKTLFKIDTASEGLTLHSHQWIKDADVVALGWVNQGMLSLTEIEKIHGMGKRIVWTMHDMWNMTGVCHHAGDCARFLDKCGNCPLLGKFSYAGDISRSTWKRKKALYSDVPIKFVAVSSWLAEKARKSSLMKDADLTVLPNAFPIEKEEIEVVAAEGKNPMRRVIFGAARLDDPIKGLPVLLKSLEQFRKDNPEKAERLELITFGAIKNPDLLTNLPVKHTYLGTLRGGYALRAAYQGCDIVVSASDYETLPGTLIEGQAYGCIPVAFDHGGQRDIIDHCTTGYLAEWDDSVSGRAANLSRGLEWAFDHAKEPKILSAMRDSVIEKFSAESVARKFLDIIV